MKKFQHITNIKKQKYTFLIIPNSTGKVIEFSISAWIPKLFIVGILLSLITTIISYSKLISTIHELNIANAKVIALEKENYNQAKEISLLTLRSAEIEEKLLSLNELKNHVLDMVGLDSSEVANADVDDPLFVISRSYQRSTLSIEDYEEAMLYLETLIEKQKENMNQLVEDVENQLQYLDKLPNIMPTVGRITSPYGYRISPINGRREFHKGIDIANATNTKIKAAASGVVTYSGYNGAYGRMIIISHGNGYTTVYAHNRQNLVEVGQRVNKGDVIAKMGSTGRSTGPHLHFEVRLNGKPVNPQELINN